MLALLNMLAAAIELRTCRGTGAQTSIALYVESVPWCACDARLCGSPAKCPSLGKGAALHTVPKRALPWFPAKSASPRMAAALDTLHKPALPCPPINSPSVPEVLKQWGRGSFLPADGNLVCLPMRRHLLVLLPMVWQAGGRRQLRVPLALCSRARAGVSWRTGQLPGARLAWPRL